ncbi:UDP-N-acetylglucosamine transferase subunit ALG13 homolog [Trichonephila inaurata madagascariensis]|uniref:UDP-N-acetylglucosamine transferase subunit ALG13 n=1 Tax=Trichonephila inaurata madagascariensis TaxID=2747483 RepID=A0A8X6WP93_9ARAC|nr:UDP-N-acetylglucosamine transferase subunit ALG13 homolog [Trichonephila inaurata madagascariensis]
MSVFVTVGSTSFDDLIKTVCSPEILQFLSDEGFKKIILQIGRGTVIPDKSDIIEVEWFHFKDSISQDIKNASLIIGHAGAGTILESLIEHKPLITVLNDKLMDNHQTELAEEMAKEGYLSYCSCSNLLETLKHSKSFTPFISEPNMFPAFLEELMGLSV